MADEPHAGATARSYLRVALDAAQYGRWDQVKENAAEAAKYAGIAAKVERVKQGGRHE